jgi:hypothetical protein
LALALGVLTVTASAPEAVRESRSVTFAVKEKDPDFEGFPLTIPAASSDKPAGSEPVATFQE